MYFWKIDNLKKDLAKNTVSEKEQFKYLLATTILYSLFIIPFMENNIWDIYSAIVSGIIAIFGTYYIYRINGGSNGKYILQRFLSLGWVIGIRWLVLIMLPIMIIYFIGLEIFSTGIPEYTTVYDLVLINLIYLIYFCLLGKHIKEVSVKSENSK